MYSVARSVALNLINLERGTAPMPAVFGVSVPRESRIPAAAATPLAVNFRQKQQKQRKLGSPDGVLERLRCCGRGVGAAGRAFRVLPYADRVKAGAQRIIEQQGPVEAVAQSQQLLEDFDRLQGAEDAGDGTEDAGGLAARDEVGRGRLTEQAAVARVARAEIGPEGRDLPLEGGERRRHERLLEAVAEVGQQRPRGEVVVAG